MKKRILFSIILILSILSIARVPIGFSGPVIVTTDTLWTLTNEDLLLVINRTSGWIQNLKYDSFDALPNKPVLPYPYHSQLAFALANGTFWNFWSINSSSTSSGSNYARLALNLHTDYAGITSKIDCNLTYTLYSNRLEMSESLWINQPGLGNLSLMNRIGTDYSDWDSVIIFGGDHAFTTITQFNCTDAFGQSYNYGYETICHAYNRPMAYPLIMFIRPNLAMSLYNTNFFNHTSFDVWDNSSGHLFRTDFGCGLENPPANYTFARNFALEFTPVNVTQGWLNGVKSYIRRTVSENNIDSLQEPANENWIDHTQLYDIHPKDWYNTTRLNAAKQIGAYTLWLYGWQANNETYPITGSWTTASDSIAVNATYFKATIENLKAQGFHVYLYFRDWTDYNVTITQNPLWCEKVNASANGYYFGWALPGDHKAVRYAFSNSSFQDYYYSLIMNVTGYYQPAGVALDWGGIGSTYSDLVDYESGDHYLGEFNLTQRLKEKFQIISNSGLCSLGFFCDGILLEDPGYNTHPQLEAYLASRLYNSTVFILTTGQTPSSQTAAGETMWSYFALSAGVNRGYDYNFYDLCPMANLTAIYQNYVIFWDALPTRLLLTREPKNNNFKIGSNVFIGYYKIRQIEGKNNLWLIIFNNASVNATNTEIWQSENKEYEITSFYDPSYHELINITTNYYTILNLTTFTDRWLVDTASTSILDLYTITGMGLAGIALMVFAPSWLAWRIKEHGFDETAMERMFFLLILFFIGLGLFFMWVI